MPIMSGEGGEQCAERGGKQGKDRKKRRSACPTSFPPLLTHKFIFALCCLFFWALQIKASFFCAELL